ncbi:MAG: bifunctional DNA primase/polymerase, partial [Pseudomonadota bacterium]|nr:bifunctional DNA primase/polymerase [Pseudomonadota bacterium]
MLDEVLKYAAHGKPVFPCGQDKKPLTEHGFKDASTDESIVTAWWSHWPDALVAMPTGAASDTVVLDVDVKNGHDGEESLFRLQRQHEQLPDTVEVLTPSGGRHLYFEHPGRRIPCSAGKLGDGLDIRGDGGYIILPPSRIGEHQYVYEGSNPNSPAPLPGWLLELTAAKATTTNHSHSPTADAWNGVAEGGRNSELFRYACRLRARGLVAGEAETLLQTAATRCSPPALDAEVSKILRSAWRYCPDHPLNDLGNARRLLDLAGEDLRYSPETGRWLIWDGNHWGEDVDGEAARQAKTVCELVRAEAQNASDPDARRALEKHAKASGQVGRVLAMLSLAQSEKNVPVLVDQLDPDPFLLGVPGGVVDLRTGEMRGGRHQDLITKRVAAAPSEDEIDAERWHRFLGEATQEDDQLIRFLRQLAGYCLTGDTREHVLAFVYGPGGNGKSVFLNTIVGLMDEYAVTAAMDTFTA